MTLNISIKNKKIYILNLALICILLAIDLNLIYSFGVAFFCTLVVIYASYKSIKKKVESNLRNLNTEEEKDFNRREKIKIGLGAAFSWLRIGAYFLLCISVIILIDNKLFFAIPFLIGVLAAYYSVIIYQINKA